MLIITKHGKQIRYNVKESDRAYYQPSTDSIIMPLLNQFNSSQSFYSTFFHEISHSTGHKNRLNRKEVMETSFFGSCDYGTEELTAELTSAFICAEIGISNENTERNSIAYLKNWKNAIKGDKNFSLWQVKERVNQLNISLTNKKKRTKNK